MNCLSNVTGGLEPYRGACDATLSALSHDHGIQLGKQVIKYLNHLHDLKELEYSF